MKSPKRSLSQNFLVDPNLQRKVAATLEAGADDVVLEVGAGHGELSQHLVGRVARLVLVEKDDELAAEIAERWGEQGGVEVVHGDALELPLSKLVRPGGRPYRVLSNVPYGITSPLLFRFLEMRPPAARIVVTLQKEVADRIAAGPGSKAYGSLTVGIAARADVRRAFDVSRQAFRPVPDVDSTTVIVEPDPERVESVPDEALRALTRAAFSRRRKQLQKILRTAPRYALSREAAEELCRKMDLDPKVRPEKLPPETFVRLARRLEG